MPDIVFQQIAPRCGSQNNAFEELCCQLAHKDIHKGASYTRLNGAGGDGGVECYIEDQSGNLSGWQAKYLFDIDSLLKQLTKSLNTALKIHSNLTRYYICFPFNLTGKTGRKGKGSKEKFDNWCQELIKQAKDSGRNIEIIGWSESTIRELLVKHDVSGGIRKYFFNQTLLTDEWFSKHLELVKVKVGPRYTDKLKVETELTKWFNGFGRTKSWFEDFTTKIQICKETKDDFLSQINKTNFKDKSPLWPIELNSEAKVLVTNLDSALLDCEYLLKKADQDLYKKIATQLNDIIENLRILESKLVIKLEDKYGKGKANSPSFRQNMAEYMVSFPTSNLDSTRETIKVLNEFNEWLHSPACSLAYEQAFVLYGGVGIGKTHGICDIAFNRFSKQLLTCVTFGHDFDGTPDPWVRLMENLGLSSSLGKDGFLDLLNTAGEASGSLLLLCIDAINETKPLKYWYDRIISFICDIQSRTNIKLCITCRTTYIVSCLPDNIKTPKYEHKGFINNEHIACQAFFNFYKLDPPILPILQPEFANPLYLRLLCETLKSLGVTQIPSGYYGISSTIRNYLKEKEKVFAKKYNTLVDEKIVAGCLIAIVQRIAESSNASIPFSIAQKIINEARPQTNQFKNVLNWLIGEELLISEEPILGNRYDSENVVRPSFERLGDFLIAEELLERYKDTNISALFKKYGPLYFLVKDSESIQLNKSVISTLSILISEKHKDVELPYLIDNKMVEKEIILITLEAFPSRNPDTFTNTTKEIIKDIQKLNEFSFEVMDVLLAVASYKSTIDAFWLDTLFKHIPLSIRDAFWCPYLYHSYESQGPVYRLINKAFELPLDKLELDIAERWATILLWFTAAADRRVKDYATRAATLILTVHPQIIPTVIQCIYDNNDDEVRERTLVSCYGALINSRNSEVTHTVTSILYRTFNSEPEEYNSALIRDQIRCIGKLAEMLNVFPESINPESVMQPIVSKWPLELPADSQVEAWGKTIHFIPDEFGNDFFKYTMNSLRPWEYAISKADMGKWLIQQVTQNLGYMNSECGKYDIQTVNKYGSGRSKPTWAERIAKKYLWISMNQLASRLYDKNLPEYPSGEKQPIKTPLILVEERKIDTSLSVAITKEYHINGGWWLNADIDLESTKNLTDEQWVKTRKDITTLKNILPTIQRNDQNWRLLVSYLMWGSPNIKTSWNDPYRNIKIVLESFLVHKKDVKIAFDSIHKRNLSGGWMPENTKWNLGFFSEYPWGIPFNMEPEEWHKQRTPNKDIPVEYIPTWAEIGENCEYDASLPGEISMYVPNRVFFGSQDLWWDGKDGYHLLDGKTVFRDPAITEEGAGTLIVDNDELLKRLDKLEMQLIWILCVEKRILGGSRYQSGLQGIFSQIALLNNDGSLCFGKQVFYDDYDKNSGPKLTTRKRIQ